MNPSATTKTFELTSASATGVQLVQLTDFHISAQPQARLSGVDTRASFATVSQAARAQANIDLLLATGDLSQDGSNQSYAYLARQFDEMGLPTFWLAGNHDQDQSLRTHFTGTQIHDAKLILIGAWLIVMLNSTVIGEVYGRLEATELDFLESALSLYSNRHALVCLHHQPLAIGSEWIDSKGLKNSTQLQTRLRQHSNVKGVLWGHVHQAAHFTRHGIAWMASPSTCIQFKTNSKEFAITSEAPGYRQLSLQADGTIETKVRRVALPANAIASSNKS